MIKKAYTKLNINSEEFGIHTLRQTCATILIKNNTDIHTIQKVLGHENVTTTEIYAKMEDSEVRDAMLSHPMSQFKIADALAY